MLIYLSYSPNHKYSIGYIGKYYRKNNIALNGIQLNILLKRYNLAKSQTNFYLKSLFGNIRKNFKNNLYSFIGFAANSETRRHFISYENKYYQSKDKILKYLEQSLYIGVAPYLADYGNIHSWIMLKINHITKSINDKIIYTPLIRLFKGTNLLEFGLSSNKRLLLNFIKRF